jgi:catechol 2,3-dioxygenase-like lactoylglutathione lyase family enzyme
MKVKGISWLGVGTDHYDETLRLFRDVLGLEVAVGHQRQALLKAGDAVVELFGNEGRGKSLCTPPVAAFEVDDVEAAGAELRAAGVELVGEVGRWNGFEWLYFRSPDGHLFSVKKTPPPGWETAD